MSTTPAEEPIAPRQDGAYYADMLPLGTRFLYRLEGTAQVLEGVLEEWSPSGRFCSVGFGEWVDSDIRIVEILPPRPYAAPTPKPEA